MKASTHLLRLTLLLVALSAALGPSVLWQLFGECLVDCCCGTTQGSASDECGCEVDEPVEPAWPGPQVPVTATEVVSLELVPLSLSALHLPEPSVLVAFRFAAVKRLSGAGPPARLLHCSLTI
jgi:hypothetical protein